jgi:hypothetical protein
MAKDSFKDLYPEYDLIPSSESRLANILKTSMAYLGVVVAIGFPVYFLYRLSNVQLPVPNQAGINKMSLSTARVMAISQMQSGQYSQAAIGFQNYFAWGGSDIETMRYYVETLKALGLNREAERWNQKIKSRKSGQK